MLASLSHADFAGIALWARSSFFSDARVAVVKAHRSISTCNSEDMGIKMPYI